MSVTDTIFETRSDVLPDAMDGEPWQRRLKDLGISQSDLAEALGITPTNLSTGLRGKWRTGEPQHLKALIMLLEITPDHVRKTWLAAAKAERSSAKP